MGKSNQKGEAINSTMQNRAYLSPGSIGIINGIRVLAKEILPDSSQIACPCVRCVFQNDKICQNKLDIQRPACFGNDKENLSKKPLIYQAV